jgi:gluconate 2-dehydrogenase gamma chain
MTLSDNPIGASYLYLLEPEIRFLEAAVEHLIPTDELGPGARDAGVVVYIDRALASTWGVHGRQYRGGPWLEGTPQQGYQSRFTPQEVYRIAIPEINEHCKVEFDRPFAQLASDRQLRLLEQLEKDEIALPSLSSKFFFDMLWRNTEEGYSSRPVRCRSMRKAFRSTSSSNATATRRAEMSATKLKSVDVVVVGSGVSARSCRWNWPAPG